ncbi:lipase/acylhydrolase [Clostridia bacterium]|nr:lipase/acylhydrolase [Clostridia bacterium]GHV31573.1 lipase/acylhydrolase [Clostridia bacterium]
MENTMKIGVWGDSVLLGVVLDEVAGKYRVLKENAVAMCAQAMKLPIDNFSRFGCTVEKGKQKLLKFLERGDLCDVALLEYGGNDCNLKWGEIAANPELEHIPAVPLKRFAEQMQEMITALKEKGVRPLLASLPPLHAERFLSWVSRDGLDKSRILQFLGDPQRIYRHQERYSLEVARLARENGCDFVDIRAAFLDCPDFGELLCADGMHPNEKGQGLIRETLMKVFGR